MAFFSNKGAEKNKQTKLLLLCLAHITQNQYSSNKVLQTLSLMCNYVSQKQSLGNYLYPLFIHELEFKTDTVWSFLQQFDCKTDLIHFIEQTVPSQKIFQKRNRCITEGRRRTYSVKANLTK